MYELPVSTSINGVVYTIRNKGDYRVILDCFSILQDEELNQEFQIITALLVFYDSFESRNELLKLGEETLQTLIQFMFKFINCGNEDQAPGAVRDSSLINWNDDSQIICSAINHVAGQEIRALPYLHWWTFMGYFMSIGQSVLSTVLGIRDKIHRGKKLEDWEKDFRKNNPSYFVRKQSKEDKEMDEYIRSLWNRGDS